MPRRRLRLLDTRRVRDTHPPRGTSAKRPPLHRRGGLAADGPACRQLIHRPARNVRARLGTAEHPCGRRRRHEPKLALAADRRAACPGLSAVCEVRGGACVAIAAVLSETGTRSRVTLNLVVRHAAAPARAGRGALCLALCLALRDALWARFPQVPCDRTKFATGCRGTYAATTTRLRTRNAAVVATVPRFVWALAQPQRPSWLCYPGGGEAAPVGCAPLDEQLSGSAGPRRLTRRPRCTMLTPTGRGCKRLESRWRVKPELELYTRNQRKASASGFTRVPLRLARSTRCGGWRCALRP